MNQPIRIGILGYGNLGRGVECAIKQNPDMTLCAVFTRRAPESVQVLSGVPVYHVDELMNMQDKIDVLGLLLIVDISKWEKITIEKTLQLDNVVPLFERIK